MRAIGLTAALALAGCGALTDYHSARTLAPGETEVGLEASAITVAEEARIDGALPRRRRPRATASPTASSWACAWARWGPRSPASGGCTTAG